MLISAFNTPKNHPKSKPFIDHVISLNWLNGRIWFRNYQIVNENDDQFTEKDDIQKLSLVEMGPRFCLMPIKFFESTLGGEALWQNEEFISPTKKRSKRYDNYLKKREQKDKRKSYEEKMHKEGKAKDHFLEEAF